MSATTSTVGALIKRLYDNHVNDHVNSRDDLLGRIRKDYSGDGEEFYKLHRVGGTPSIRYQSEASLLPTAGNQRWDNSVVKPKEMWGTLRLSQALIMKTKTNAGGFMRGLDSEMYGFANDWKRRMEMALVNDGSGVYGNVSSVVTADDEIVFGNNVDARKFFANNIIQVINVKNNAAATLQIDNSTDNGTEFRILSVDPASSRIKLDPTYNPGGGTTGDLNTGVTIGSGDFVIFSGSRTLTSGGVRYETMGITGAVHDRDTPMEDGANGGGGFQNILSNLQFDGTGQTGESTWASARLANAGILRPITETLLQQACDAVEIQGNGMVDTFVSPYGARLEYAVGQLNIRRNTNTNRISGDTAGGFKENTKGNEFVQYAGYEIIPNRYMPQDLILAMSWDRQYLKFWAKPQWWDDGNILRRSPTQTTEYWAEHFSMYEYVMEERNAHCRIEDLENDELAVG